MTKHSLLKSCFNWKIILPLVVVVAIVWFLFRDQWNTSAWLPFVFLLICPLSMIFMMKSMNHDHCSKSESADKPKRLLQPRLLNK